VALQNPEAFESYCQTIEHRLEAQAGQRVRFLQAAEDRLNNLQKTALAVQDQALYNELSQCRHSIQQMLETLQAGGAAHSMTGHIAAEARYVVPVPSMPPPAKPRPLEAVSAPLPPSFAREFTNAEAFPQRSFVPTETRLPRRPMRSLEEIEADAVRLRAMLSTWEETYPMRRENGELHIPHALQLRSVACRQRKLEEEAGDVEVAEVTDLGNDLRAIFARADDNEPTVGLETALDPAPTIYQWGELADRYNEMGRAFEAFLWWKENGNDLALADVQPLAEAISAIQGRFNRLLYRVNSRDQFQQTLYEDLRSWAKDAQCYLYSLRPKVPVEELTERSATLEEAWDRAREPVHLADQKKKTLEHLGHLVTSHGFGEEPQRDAERLRIALHRCKELRIAATDRRLKEVLLPWAALLETEDQFRDILREVTAEWVRRLEMMQLEDTPQERIPLTGLEKELRSVRAAMRGSCVLIVGGITSEEMRERFEKTFEPSVLVWQNEQPTNTLEDFEAEIRRADVVILVTRYSRKEWLEARSLCLVDKKPCYQVLTASDMGYLVKMLHEQIG
jgi:hypothetical protein